jgi:hypothetical protein
MRTLGAAVTIFSALCAVLYLTLELGVALGYVSLAGDWRPYGFAAAVQFPPLLLATSPSMLQRPPALEPTRGRINVARASLLLAVLQVAGWMSQAGLHRDAPAVDVALFLQLTILSLGVLASVTTAAGWALPWGQIIPRWAQELLTRH